MRRAILFFLIILTTSRTSAQSLAQQRAASLGLGTNLSFMENWWDGTKARHYGDFLTMSKVMLRKQRIADIARAGFKTVRVPVNFGAWATMQPPYRWDSPEMLAAPDSVVKWALANNLRVLIDLHHVEFDKGLPGADTTARVVWLWQQIAEQYKNTDPSRVLFELRNEPNGMAAGVWRAQAGAVIAAVRAIAPNHTLVVGFHDWNGRKAMIESEPFADPNIIYTFHYYDPFIFTHQGASWAGQGLPDLKNVPFPGSPNVPIAVPASARGTWVEGAITGYATQATYETIAADLAAAKAWATAKNVPIFLGEFGSYNLNAAPDSRCRHAEAVYVALGKLQIPSAWWEWDGGFSMNDKDGPAMMPCMRDALTTYATGQLRILSTEPQRGALRLFPNPASDLLRVESDGPPATQVRITDMAGRVMAQPMVQASTVSVAGLSAGQYTLTVLGQTGDILGTARVLKP